MLVLHAVVSSGLIYSYLVQCIVLLVVVLIGCRAVIVGSAITGPIGKECADLWPRIASAANAIV